MVALEILFWVVLSLVWWTFFGYLLVLKVVSCFHTKPIVKGDDQPPISLVITAFNEEERLNDKIKNSLGLDYPREKLEIVVVSDGSTDETCNIARSYLDQGVKLIEIEERNGKHYAQGKGIAAAQNDLVLLSDVSTFLKPDAARKIIRGFADPTVGCISGTDSLKSSSSSSAGEGLYVRYEMYLRNLESAVGSLMGVSGSFFAIRKDICRDWIDDMSADFYLAILTRMSGRRTIMEPEAIGYYDVTSSQSREFRRKVRTVVHGMEVLFKFKRILNPLRYGSFSLQMLSHKLSRWLVPFYMIVLVGSNVALIGTGQFFRIFLGTQVIFYLLAGAAIMYPRLQTYLVFRVPAFLIMVHWSILVSWFHYFFGRKFVTWDATKR